MRISFLERTQRVSADLDQVFAFFANPQNLAAITPPWLEFRIIEAPPEVYPGALIRYRLRLKGLPIRWLTEIKEWQPRRSFTDVQQVGPYRLWEHTHRLAAVPEGTEIFDHVRYRVPGGPLAPLVERFVRPLLDEIFDYRARRVAELFADGRDEVEAARRLVHIRPREERDR